MADPWNSAHWLRAGIPWSRSFKLIGGAYVNKDLRLVRPAADAGMRDTWVADHFGRQTQVAVTFASGHFDAEGRSIDVPAEVRSAQAERFAHRALLGATLADPHLVQIFETGDARGVPFIVTELLEGKSLRHRLVQGDGALSLPEARAVLSQVAAVLAKCHAQQIAHGDIRSDHLFAGSGAAAGLTSEPFVKIGNLAAGPNLAAPRGEEASSLLDNAYASPERLLRSSVADAGSDVWALAVTLYELLTTTLPFEASTPAGVAVAICNAQFSPPSHYRADLPATVDAWFARAFAREPHERFKNVLELAQSFGQALDGAEPRASADVGAWSEPALDDDDDDGEEEEKTVKWDLPADWSLPGSSPGAVALGSSGPPPLPVPGSELSARKLAAAASPSTLPPQGRPGAFFTGDLARVARLPPAPNAFTLPALRAVPAAYPAAVPAPRRRIGMLGQGLLFGAALGAVSALSLWIVQSVSSSGEGNNTASTELALEPSYDSDGNVIAQKPSARRVPDPKELPRIIQTDDLPTLPEDAEDELEEPSAQTITVSSVKSEAAPARPAPRGATLSQPLLEKPGLAFANRPSSPPPAAPSARRPARPPARKQAKAAASCNPPYFFDSNNIRRLKLECL